MSLIFCPECKSKISSTAKQCPHCGFTTNNVFLPISAKKYEPVPVLKCDFGCWNPIDGELVPLSGECNNALVEIFNNWENIQNKLPALANVVKSLAKKEKILVAKIPEYLQKLIDSGELHLAYDKNGEILAQVKDEVEKIAANIRLEEVEKISPNAIKALTDLACQREMHRIIDEVKLLGEGIQNIHVELQNDRLALADSAIRQLKQATYIQDNYLKQIEVLSIISKANDAQCRLEKNVENNLAVIYQKRNDMLLKKITPTYEDASKNSLEAMQSIVSIANAVQIECLGYQMLNEVEAEKECLIQFKDFIIKNKLNERNTLLKMNETLGIKQPKFVDEFVKLSCSISKYEKDSAIGMKHIYLEGGKNNE